MGTVRSSVLFADWLLPRGFYAGAGIAANSLKFSDKAPVAADGNYCLSILMILIATFKGVGVNLRTPL